LGFSPEGVNCIGQLKIRHFFFTSGKKMKIKKTGDGVLWIFNESAPELGWRKTNDEALDPGEVFSELIKIKQEEKKDLSYGMAFSEVQKENLDLAKRYLDQVRAKR
jgi:hypothetical protein